MIYLLFIPGAIVVAMCVVVTVNLVAARRRATGYTKAAPGQNKHNNEAPAPPEGTEPPSGESTF